MSDSETPRPRAEYGEYATPEEQQRARGVSEPSNHSVPAPQGAAYVAPPGPAEPPARPAHPVDRVFTLVLLAFGLVTLLTGIPGYLALPDALQTVYDQLDAGTYPARQEAAGLGVASLVVQAAIWFGTAAFAWFAIKRGRLAWWIALLGGVLTFIAMMVIVSMALFADPNFLDNVSPQDLPRTSF